MTVRPRAEASRRDVAYPRLLVLAGGWGWRLLAAGVAAYAVVRVLALLWLVVVPVVAAVLLAALLRPVAVLLRRRLPGPLAAILTLLLALIVLGGVGYLVARGVAAQLPTLVDELVATIRNLRADLGILGVGQVRLDSIEASVVDWLQTHREQVLGLATTGATYVVDAATVVALTLFTCFFFLYDGERIWRSLLAPLPPTAADRLDVAGRTAWSIVTGYVRGTAVIATIHGVVIGLVLHLLGVPLAVPLGVLVFLGSFVPIVGALVAGGLAVLVTLGTQGWLAAVILLGVLIGENQLEGHLLQPLIVGRYVRLHPLLVGLALVVGSVLGGIAGAVVAVPTAAVLIHALPAMTGRDHPPGREAAPTGSQLDGRRRAGARFGVEASGSPGTGGRGGSRRPKVGSAQRLRSAVRGTGGHRGPVDGGG